LGHGKLDPFVNAGYTRLQRGGGANGVNFGGGVNYWFKRHLGVRIEIRDHVMTDIGSVHFWGVRFGVAF
jgi:hypothetical protein